MQFFEAVYALVQQIPTGYVSTYGDIARAIGNPRMARQVGWALHANPKPGVIPCHRVVNQKGRVSAAFRFGGENMQIKLLTDEGISIAGEVVDLSQYRYTFTREDVLRALEKN